MTKLIFSDLSISHNLFHKNIASTDSDFPCCIRLTLGPDRRRKLLGTVSIGSSLNDSLLLLSTIVSSSFKEFSLLTLGLL